MRYIVELHPVIGHGNHPRFVAVGLKYRSVKHRVDALKTYMRGQPDESEQLMGEISDNNDERFVHFVSHWVLSAIRQGGS